MKARILLMIGIVALMAAGTVSAQTGYGASTKLDRVSRIQVEDDDEDYDEDDANSYHRKHYRYRSEPEYGFSVRLAYTEPLGSWNEAPYVEHPVDMFNGGLGFDVDFGIWADQAGIFIGVGGNAFDMREYEQYVADGNQAVAAKAHMFYLRTEVKGRLPHSGNVVPVLKAGIGYYLLGGDERYREDGAGSIYADYGDTFFNNNVGFNFGGELSIRNHGGPAFIVSLDVIYVLDAVVNRYDYFDDYQGGLTQLKAGIGIGF